MACGINLDFTALKGKLEELKTGAMAEINSTIASARDAIKAKMDAFEVVIRGWVPELPDVAPPEGDSMLPPLLALVAAKQAIPYIVDPIQKYAAEIAFDLIYKEFKVQYDEAIKKSGFDVDKLIEGLDSGIDPCSLVPNILTMPDGAVGEVPKIPRYAQKDAVGEDPSTKTPEMIALEATIQGDLSETKASMEASTTLVESKLESIPERKSQREDIKKAKSAKEYYVNTKDLQKTDKELADAITGHPSTALTTFINTKRGESTPT
jgi:hypothetical protein